MSYIPWVWPIPSSFLCYALEDLWCFHARGLIHMRLFSWELWGCWIIQSRRSISTKVRSTSCWIINDSPADVIFHPMSHCKPLPFSSNWCTFIEVPGVPSLHNCFLAVLTLLVIRIKYSLQRLKCFVLWMHIIWKTLCMITQCSRINGFLSIWWQTETGGKYNAFSSKHTPCSKPHGTQVLLQVWAWPKSQCMYKMLHITASCICCKYRESYWLVDARSGL